MNSISRKVGSGRKRTLRTTQNIECVAKVICSQEGHPGSSKIPGKKGTLNSCLLDCLQVLLYEVFAVLLRHIRKHVFPLVFIIVI